MAAMKECRSLGMNVERLVARVFVVGGGLFWIAASFMGDYGYHRVSALVSARNALLPLALSVIVLAIGWFFEYLASGILAVTTAGIVAWGVVTGWEIGVWVLIGITLMLPVVVAGALFFLAARMDTICAVQPARAAA